jgi:hypothetical protein
LSRPEFPASSYGLGGDAGNDLWAKGRTSPAWMRHVLGGHADGPWQPLADGALFTVRLDGKVLRVEPANQAAAAVSTPPDGNRAAEPGFR